MNKLTYTKTFFPVLIAGMTTGMGNGSVFGAAVMCAVGRAPYTSWGGIPWTNAYNPVTFGGFVDWMMILFGVAFSVIWTMAMKKHGDIETQRSNVGW